MLHAHCRAIVGSTILAAALMAGSAFAVLPTGADTELAYLAGGNRVVLVNTTTGGRGIVSGTGVGTGPAFISATGYVNDLLIEDSTNLLVAAEANLFRVNRTTGDRTLIPLVHSGAPVITTSGILQLEWETSNTILFLGRTMSNQPYFGRIDLGAGTRSVISIIDDGKGPNFMAFGGQLLTEPAGTLLYVDFGSQQIIRINPTTGNRTKIHTNPIVYSVTMSRLSNGDLFLTEFATDRYMKLYRESTDTMSNVGGGLGVELPDPVHPVKSAAWNNGDVLVFNGQTGQYDPTNIGPSLIKINSSTGVYTTVANSNVPGDIPMVSYMEYAGLVIVDPGPSSVNDWRLY